MTPAPPRETHDSFLGCALAPLVLLLAGCGGTTGAVMEEARVRVERVQPGFDLSDVELVVWRDNERLVPLYEREVEPLSHPFVRRTLRAHQVLFERLRLVDPGELALAPLVGDDPVSPAFILPTCAVTVARPFAARSLDTLAHEYAHHVSYRRGYWEIPKPIYSLHPGRPGAPEWIDLDAFLAAWAIEEGIAVVTEDVATDDGLERWRVRRDQAPGSLASSMVLPLYPRVRTFAYVDGPRAVLIDGFDSLEEGFAATWARFRGTTREVLLPDELPRPSALADWCRASVEDLVPAPVSATRVGTVLLLQAVAERHERRNSPAWEVVEPLLDDLFLSFDDTHQVWVTEWRDGASARRFLPEISAIAPEALVTAYGRRVWVTWGEHGDDLRMMLARRIGETPGE